MEKNYRVNPNLNFNEELLDAFTQESGIVFDAPLGNFALTIREKDNKEFNVSNIGNAGIICRYIMKDYMAEDHDLFLVEIFQKIRRYGRYINLDFQRLTKKSINIELRNNYQSIKDINSLTFEYDIELKSRTRYQTETTIKIGFNGESCYDFNVISGASARLNININYYQKNDLFIQFIEAYKARFAKKVGVSQKTETEQLKTLIDMILF